MHFALWIAQVNVFFFSSPFHLYGTCTAHFFRHLCGWQAQWYWVDPQQGCKWQQAVQCHPHAGGKGHHPEGPWWHWVMGSCKSHEVQRGQVQGLAHGVGQPKHKYRLGKEWIENSPGDKKDLGTRSVPWAGNVHLLPAKQALSWAASKEAWPTGQGRWFCPSVPVLWDVTWNTASSSGSSSIRRPWTCWSESKIGRQRCPEGASTSPVKVGWESWSFQAEEEKTSWKSHCSLPVPERSL